MSPTPLPPDWPDDRLDAAFRARFEAPAPPDLGEKVHAALAIAPRGARFSFPNLGRLAVASVAALAIVAVAVVSWTPILRGPSQPGQSTNSHPFTATPRSPAPRPTPVIAGGAIPISITVPGSTSAQPVLSVSEAIAVRSSSQPQREIVVGGWYEMNPVPCAAIPDATPDLENCAVDFTWLMQNPERLSELNADGSGSIHAPSGPGVNLTFAFTNWDAPSSEAGPVPIVVIGHFDDRRAAACPDGPRRMRCEAIFVVDAPLWTTQGSIDLAAAPASVNGQAVLSVDQALAVRDGGSSNQVAVEGWYNPPFLAMRCSFIPTTSIGWLEGYCQDSTQWLMASPELLVTTTPNETGIRPPTGIAFQVAFDPSGPTPRPTGNGWPTTGSPIPVPAVFVGHFNDPRSNHCPSDAEPGASDSIAGCRGRFVVDGVVWINGIDQRLF